MSSDPVPYVWFLAAVVGATPILVTRSRQWWRRRRSTDWKPVQASIHNIEQVDPHRNGGTYLRLSYSYYIEEFRSGEYHFLVAENLLGEEIARLLKGASVDAFCDPRDPDRSILTDANLYATAARVRKLEIAQEPPPPYDLSFDVAHYDDAPSTDTPHKD